MIDSRIWLPSEVGGRPLPRKFLSDLRGAFTHANPDYWRKKSMGFATWGTPAQIKTHDEREDRLGKRLTLPRGGIVHLRETAAAHGFRLRFVDRRSTCTADFPTFRVSAKNPALPLRYYQSDAVAAALARQQGVIRSPTGSGKTIAALAFVATAGQRAMVIMRDGNLLKQWVEVAAGCLDLPPSEIGIIRGGRKYKPGKPLVLALQQSLHKMGDDLPALLREDPIGALIVDECQTVAARTFLDVVDRIPAKYRIGFSADETRRDKKEFVIYDQMGPVIAEVERQELEAAKVIHPVTIRVVETGFRADWYRNAPPGEKDFGRLIEEMVGDEDRNAILLDIVGGLVEEGETPALVFTHRREHAAELADRQLSVRRGVLCGLLLGGVGVDAQRFADDRAKLIAGDLQVAVGTFNAIGVGIDLPLVRAGVVATPISGKNPQFFGQVRGRICRTTAGKDSAVVYYVLDKHVFPNQIRNLMAWNDGRVEIQRGGEWVRVKGSGDGW